MSKPPVLVILEPTLKAKQPALLKGAQLARAGSHPLHVTVNPFNSAVQNVIRSDPQRERAILSKIHEAWHERVDDVLSGSPHELQVFWDKDRLKTVREAIMSQQPAVAVVHTSDESRLKRHLFTPIDWQLIRKAPCPVLCVHSHPWQAAPLVAAAVDPDINEEHEDQLSSRVIGSARHYAAILDGTLRAVHVLEDMDETMLLLAGESIPEYASSSDKVRAFHRDNFHQYAAAEGLDEEQQEVLEGPVASTLASYCEDNDIDLLVVGTVKRSLPERFLLGATSEAVIARASTDVLVVKPDDFESPWQQN